MPLKEHGRIFWEATLRFYKDHGPEHAGNMAFLGMLALFPFLICMLALSGLFGQTEAGRDAIRFLLTNLPVNVAETISGPIQNIVETAGGGILTGSMLFAVWTSMLAVEAARLTVIQAYDSWEHAAPVWWRFLENLALVILSAILVLIAMSLVVLTPVLIELIRAVVPLPERTLEYSFWARYLVAPVLMFLALLGVYRAFTPKMPENKRYQVPGALFTVLVWLSVGKGIAWYLKTADRYDLFYGSLAGVVVTQLFLFFLSGAFIIGAHLNASYSRHRGLRDWRAKLAREAETAPAQTPPPPEADTESAAAAKAERKQSA